MKTEWTNESKKFDLNPSDEKLRKMIAQKDAEIARLKTDAERYRKLKRDWLALYVKDRPLAIQRFILGFENQLDSFVDALPEVRS